MRIAVIAVVVVTGATAAHADSDERALSFGAGFASYATPNSDMDATLSPTAGLAVSTSFERALGPEVSVVGDLSIAGYLGGGTAGSALGTVGLVYRIDILKYVPYVAVSAGGLGVAGGPFATGVEPALRLGGGVDILQSRSRSYGLTVAMTSFASATTTLAIGLRSTWRWGYF